MSTYNKDKGGGDVSSERSGSGRKIECWTCGGDHLKRNFLNIDDKTISKDRSGKKSTNGKADTRYGQLHAMFISISKYTLGLDLSHIDKFNKLSWHQFHTAGRKITMSKHVGGTVWRERDFEGHVSVSLHKNSGRTVSLMWILLDSQSTVDLIAKANMMVNIRKVRDEDAILAHCNSGMKVVNQAGDLPGYGNFW